MRRRWMAVAGWALLSAGIAGMGQLPRQNPMSPPIQTPSSGRNPSGMPSISGDPDADATNARLEDQRAKSRNADRQKKLVSDTDRLVDLVTNLKQEVETPGAAAQPGDVSKKAEEIEKLAKSVKDRMKG